MIDATGTDLSGVPVCRRSARAALMALSLMVLPPEHRCPFRGIASDAIALVIGLPARLLCCGPGTDLLDWHSRIPQGGAPWPLVAQDRRRPVTPRQHGAHPCSTSSVRYGTSAAGPLSFGLGPTQPPAAPTPDGMTQASFAAVPSPCDRWFQGPALLAPPWLRPQLHQASFAVWLRRR